MLKFSRWNMVLISLVCLASILFSLPNLLPQTYAKYAPSWAPDRQVNLGLDLQGGSYLLLKVDIEHYFNEQYESITEELRRGFRKKGIQAQNLTFTPQNITFSLSQELATNEATLSEIKTILSTLSPDLELQIVEGQAIITFAEEAQLQRTKSAVDQSIEIIRRRIDETGTKEPIIQKQGVDRIIVQLPGVDNPEQMKTILGKTAKLTLHLVDSRTSEASQALAPSGTMILESVDGNKQFYVVKKRAELGGESLIGAQTEFHDGVPVVAFRFDSMGARKFGKITAENIGRQLAIVLDNKVISAPVIQSPILEGNGVISGGGITTESANELALLLRAGALPTPLEIIEERTVGPSLGSDSIKAGVMAALIGAGLVIVFMVGIYGIWGVFANISLFFNMLLLLSGLSILQATLTLPGIAGIVLTLGMAVDANVLIYERIKDELKRGVGLHAAISAGFQKAIGTIIDANLTTFFAALLLFQFGSGPIKGFAVTLSLGLLTSMFSAIMITRMQVYLMMQRQMKKVKSKPARSKHKVK